METQSPLHSEYDPQARADTAPSDGAFASPAFVVGKPVTPDHGRTCGQCQYDGPLQVRRTYPLILRWPMIAAGFVCGIVPGVFLLSWRRQAPSTLAMTCPMCQFMRLEQAPASHA